MLETGPAVSTTGATIRAGTRVMLVDCPSGNSFCKGLRLILVLVVDLFHIFCVAKDDATTGGGVIRGLTSDHASKSQRRTQFDETFE